MIKCTKYSSCKTSGTTCPPMVETEGKDEIKIEEDQLNKDFNQAEDLFLNVEMKSEAMDDVNIPENVTDSNTFLTVNKDNSMIKTKEDKQLVKLENFDEEEISKIFQNTSREVIESLLTIDSDKSIEVCSGEGIENTTMKNYHSEGKDHPKSSIIMCKNSNDSMLNIKSDNEQVERNNQLNETENLNNHFLIPDNQVIQNSQGSSCLYESVEEKYIKKKTDENSVNSILTCEICLKIFLKKENFDSHLITEHNNDRSYLENPEHLMSIFQCAECDNKLLSKQSLEGHIVSKHSNNDKVMLTVTRKVYSCDKCKYKTINKTWLKTHLERHRNIEANKKFQCDSCNYTTTEKDAFKRHIQRHAGLLFYSCQICSKKYGRKHSLDSHIVTNHPENEEAMARITQKVHSCKICDYKTVYSSRYKSHLMKHKRIKTDKNFQCDTCVFQSKRKHNLKQHIQRYGGVPHFSCTVCGKVFRSKFNLNRHIVQHHAKNENETCETPVTSSVLEINLEDLQFKCDSCDYKTIRKRDLKRHIKIHLDLFEYPCQLCSKKFRSKSSLDYHIVSKHSEDENAMTTLTNSIFYCDMCEYKTVKSANLKDHLKTHEGSNEFMCDKCTYRTMRKKSLDMHMKIHLGLFGFHCQLCTKKFRSKSNLDGHIVSKHSENESAMTTVTNRVFYCDMCTYKTGKSTNLKKHLEKHRD